MSAKTKSTKNALRRAMGVAQAPRAGRGAENAVCTPLQAVQEVSVSYLRPVFALTLLLCLVFSSGCRSLRGGGGGLEISGGTPAERAAVHGAFNNMVPFLQGRGFPNVKMPTGRYTLIGFPPLHVWRFPDGGEQGTYLRTLPNGSQQEVGATGSASVMTYGMPLHPWIANHEAIHTLLIRAGYVAESNNHDPRAFDDRGTFPPGSRRIR